MASPLLQFLSQTRSALLHHHSKTPPPFVLVLGNPSCDLDSFISATVYAFFLSRFSRTAQPSRLHIPLLNLTTIKSSELWRFSPEFGTALGAAVKGRTWTESNRAEDGDKTLLENLITISDIRSCPPSPLHAIFAPQASSSPAAKIDVVLVDHNVLSISLPDQKRCSHLNVVGCIDHHVDESVTPPSASPRIIKTGIGSCTTLVVQYLRDHGFWDRLTHLQQRREEGSQLHKARPQEQHNHSDENNVAAVELAKLSLAAILIDTTNLTAKGKVSSLDRQVVAFLEDIVISHATDQKSSINPAESSPPTQQEWDRATLYEPISQSKQSAPDRLTLTEILARDYKCWVETSQDGAQKKEKNEVKLGVSSVIKPIQWLIEKKADGSGKKLVEGLRAYAEGEELDILAVMTAYTTTPASAHVSADKGDDRGEGDEPKRAQNEAFARELLLLPVSSSPTLSNDFIPAFERSAGQDLNLLHWRMQAEDRDGTGFLDALDGASGRIWRQADVAQSRKQLAPLLREAINRHLAAD